MKEIILQLLITFAPIESRPQFEGHEETPIETLARYESIAEDIAHVAQNNEPVRGLDRFQSAVLLAAMAVGESGLSRDVDLGPCYRGPGLEKRCDEGRSASMWQLQSVDKAAVFANRKLAATIALERLRKSVNACWAMPPRWRLSAYGAGYCTKLPGAAKRFKLFTNMRGRALWLKAEREKEATDQ